MILKLSSLLLLHLALVEGIFFGSGGGGGGCCCCGGSRPLGVVYAQPAYSVGCAPPSVGCASGCGGGYAAAPSIGCASGCEGGGGAGYGVAGTPGCGSGVSGYASQAAPPCQPRYIVVRAAETSVIGGGYATPGVVGPPPASGYVLGPLPAAAPASYRVLPAPAQLPALQQPYQQVLIPAPPAPAPTYQAAPEAPPPAPTYQGAPSHTDSYFTRTRTRARGSKTIVVDTKCNSNELRQLLDEQIVPEDANESKRRVHKTANEQFLSEESDKGIDVICAPGPFSYRIATDFFCELTKGNVTCFVYQQQP